MTSEQYFERIGKDFSMIRTLSEKDGGSVYLMKHRELGRRVTVRLMKSVPEVYFFLKTVSFENLPEVYEAIRLDDGGAVIEEYIDGVNVGEVIEIGLYSYNGARTVLACVCDALSVIHRKGFVHRDIKPENIMISSDGKVKLIDFGAAREVKNGVGKDTEVLGTVGYAAPEQFGITQSDARCDIFSLGILLNVMLTGKHPAEETAKGRAGKIVLRCTQIDPERRFASVEELKNSL